jgi:hypothetical protein
MSPESRNKISCRPLLSNAAARSHLLPPAYICHSLASPAARSHLLPPTHISIASPATRLHLPLPRISCRPLTFTTHSHLLPPRSLFVNIGISIDLNNSKINRSYPTSFFFSFVLMSYCVIPVSSVEPDGSKQVGDQYVYLQHASACSFTRRCRLRRAIFSA